MDNFAQTFLIYLGQVSLILISFTLIYTLVSKRLTFYKQNRIALLLILVSAFLIPLLEFDIAVSTDNQLISYIDVLDANDKVKQPSQPLSNLEIESTELNYPAPVYDTERSDRLDYSMSWSQLLLAIYGIGFFSFLILFVKSLSKVIHLKRQGRQATRGEYEFLICDIQQPFSFFNLIFVNEKHLERADIQVILKHESIHGKHFHSVDVIIFELVKALLWFNPFTYYLSKQSRLNNEFHTDQLVTKYEGLEVYSNALLSLGKFNSQLTIVNSFALLSLKPRVMQLVKKPSDSKWRFSYLSFMPMLIIFLVAFSCNLNEEVGKSGQIKSIKGIFHDEYGDQSERNGSLLVDLNFDINGNLQSDKINKNSFSGEFFNDLQYKLDFVRWGEEVHILKYGQQWVQISKDMDELNAQNRVNGWKSKNPSGHASVNQIDMKGTSIYITTFVYKGKQYASSFGLNRSFDFDDLGRVSTAYKTPYYTSEMIEDFTKSSREALIDADKMGNSSLKKQLNARIAYFEEIRGKSRVKIGDFIYDGQNRLIEYQAALIASIDRRKRIFTYNEYGLLASITEYKTSGSKTCSYHISYNEKEAIEKVIAYNGRGEREYTVDYSYEYY